MTSQTLWTAARIRALGVHTSLQTAAAIFGLSKTTAYELARRDEFPVPVLRVGGRYRVPVAPILTALHLTDEPTEHPDGGAETGRSDLIKRHGHASINPDNPQPQPGALHEEHHGAGIDLQAVQLPGR